MKIKNDEKVIIVITKENDFIDLESDQEKILNVIAETLRLKPIDIVWNNRKYFCEVSIDLDEKCNYLVFCINKNGKKLVYASHTVLKIQSILGNPLQHEDLNTKIKNILEERILKLEAFSVSLNGHMPSGIYFSTFDKVSKIELDSDFLF